MNILQNWKLILHMQMAISTVSCCALVQMEKERITRPEYKCLCGQWDYNSYLSGIQEGKTNYLCLVSGWDEQEAAEPYNTSDTQTKSLKRLIDVFVCLTLQTHKVNKSPNLDFLTWCRAQQVSYWWVWLCWQKCQDLLPGQQRRKGFLSQSWLPAGGGSPISWVIARRLRRKIFQRK